jgi:hypothetical protein
MFDERHSLLSWARDISLAYAGGLVLGAPVAVGAVWVSGIDRLATLALLAAMGVVLVALRRASRRVQIPAAPAQDADVATNTPAQVTRRVA